MAVAPLRQKRLEARLRNDRRRSSKAAALKGTSVSQFVIASAEEAAERTLEERQIVELGRRDREIFVHALLNPPSPNERLRAAVERHGLARNSR